MNSVRLQDTRLIFSNLLNFCMCVCAQSLQSCLTLCDHLDCSPPCSSVHRISQAEIVEWVAISFSRGIFPTQGLNSSLLCPLHWHLGSLPLAPPGKPEFLYTNNVISEWEIFFLIFFKNHIKKNKISRNKPRRWKIYTLKMIKHWWRILTMIYKMEDNLCYWIGRINIAKMAIFPKAIHKFNAIPIKISMTSFIDYNKQS